MKLYRKFLLLISSLILTSCSFFSHSTKKDNSETIREEPIVFEGTDSILQINNEHTLSFSIDCEIDHSEDIISLSLKDENNNSIKDYLISREWTSTNSGKITLKYSEIANTNLKINVYHLNGNNDRCDHDGSVSINFGINNFSYNFYDVNEKLLSSGTANNISEIKEPEIDKTNFVGWTNRNQIIRNFNDLNINSDSFNFYPIYDYIGTDGLKYYESENQIVISGYNGSLYDVDIPNVINNKLVVAIADNAFLESKIKSIKLPATLTKIGEYAFKNTTSLEKVEIQEFSRLKTIDDYAFYFVNATSILSWFFVPKTVNEIGRYAFAYNRNLRLLFEKEENRKISLGVQYNLNIDGMYYNIKKVVEIDSSNLYSYVLFNDKTVGILNYLGIENANENLEINKIDGYDVVNVLRSSFKKTKVINLKFTSDIKEIGDYAFYGCSNIKQVNLSECKNLTRLGYMSFSKATSLTDVIIPESIKIIDDYCFFETNRYLNLFFNGENIDDVQKGSYWDNSSSYGCNRYLNVKSLNDNGLFKYFITNDNYAGILKFHYDNNELDLRNYKLDGCPIKYVGGYCFEKNKYLTSIKFGEELTYIYKYAFSGCSNLKEFYIDGKNLQYIGAQAFEDCSSLLSFYIPNTVTYIGSYCFDSCKKLNLLIEPIDLSNVEVGGQYDLYIKGKYYGIKSLNYYEFNDNGSFYYYETYENTLGLLLWDGTNAGYGPTSNLSIDEIDGKPFTKICDYAFYDARSYYESGPFDWNIVGKTINIELGHKIKEIGDYAFYNMFYHTGTGNTLNSSDQDFTITFKRNNLLETIGEAAFYSIKHKTKSVLIGKEIKSIGKNAFKSAVDTSKLSQYNIYIEKGDASNVTLGSNWSGSYNYYWGNEWYYNDKGGITLNS